jgi:hypothetical protein
MENPLSYELCLTPVLSGLVRQPAGPSDVVNFVQMDLVYNTKPFCATVKIETKVNRQPEIKLLMR